MPNWAYAHVEFISNEKNKKEIKEELEEKYLDEEKRVSPIKFKNLEKINQYPFLDLTNAKNRDISNLKKFMGFPEDQYFDNPVFVTKLERNDPKVENLNNLFKKNDLPHPFDLEVSSWSQVKKCIDIIQDEINFNYDEGLSSPYDWYDFNVETLGTKWTFKLDNLLVETLKNNSLKSSCVSFDTETAWDIPRAFFAKLATDLKTDIYVKAEYEGSHEIEKAVFTKEGNYIELDNKKGENSPSR